MYSSIGSSMAPWICLLLFGIFAVLGSETKLEILPVVQKIRNPIGSSAVVTCKSPTGGNVSQWLDPKGNKISSQTHKTMELNAIGNGLTLTIRKLAKEHQGTYTCVGTINGDQQSKTVDIVPYMGITFTDAKKEQQATVGQNYKVVCKVESDPSPIVDWYLDNSNDPLSSNNKYVVENDGLLIKSVNEADDRNYRCKVTIISEEVSDSDETDIHLSVIVPPSFDLEMTDSYEVVEGEPSDIKCKAIGKPQPIVTWIRSSNQQNMTSNLDGLLHFDKISKADDGIFICAATNAGGRIERPVHLKVLRKPEIINVQNASAPETGSSAIRCVVTGYPVPTVSIKSLSLRNFQTNMSKLAVTSGAYQDVANATIATFQFFNVSRSDNGIYECIASNKIGTDVKNMQLEVLFKPSFESMQHIVEAVSWDRKPINLTWTVEANPNATVHWFLDSRDIQNDNRFVKFDNSPEYTLTVTPVHPTDYGAYACCAENKLGKQCHIIHLREGKPPGAPGDVAFNVVTATTVSFNITEPYEKGNLPITAYIVEYKNEIDEWSSAKNVTWPAGITYVVDNLVPRFTYNFRLAAVNTAGKSDWSKYLMRQMPERSVPNVPSIINSDAPGQNYIEVNVQEFQIQWNIPADNGVPINEYQLLYCIVTQAGDTYAEDPNHRECSDPQRIPANSNTYRLANLKPNTFYKVELTAHNNIGRSIPCFRILRTGSLFQDKTSAEMFGLSSAVIIYIVIAVLIALLVICDLSCFIVANTGLFYAIFKCCCAKKKQNEEKLGSEGKDLISNGHGKKSEEENMLMINNGGSKKELAVEYDVKKGTAKTGFIGKDSAV